MTPRRKREIECVRSEGALAFRLGQHRETNPYRKYDCNRHQWWVGYDMAEEDERGVEEEH